MEIINLTDLLLHVVNLVILYFVLRFLLYKPISKFMQKRQEKYQQQDDLYQEALQNSQKTIDESERVLRVARDESAKIVRESNQLAKERMQQLTEQAHKEAEEIVARAEREAEHNRLQAQKNLQDEISDLAIAIASKVVEREVNAEDNQKLIDDFLKKAD